MSDRKVITLSRDGKPVPASSMAPRAPLPALSRAAALSIKAAGLRVIPADSRPAWKIDPRQLSLDFESPPKPHEVPGRRR